MNESHEHHAHEGRCCGGRKSSETCADRKQDQHHDHGEGHGCGGHGHGHGHGHGGCCGRRKTGAEEA